MFNVPHIVLDFIHHTLCHRKCGLMNITIQEHSINLHIHRQKVHYRRLANGTNLGDTPSTNKKVFGDKLITGTNKGTEDGKQVPELIFGIPLTESILIKFHWRTSFCFYRDYIITQNKEIVKS